MARECSRAKSHSYTIWQMCLEHLFTTSWHQLSSLIVPVFGVVSQESHRDTSLYFEDSVGYQFPSNSLNLPGKMSGRPATWPRASPRCSKVSPRAPDGARPGAGLKCSDDALASRGRGFQPFPMTDFAHVLATTRTSSTKRVLICHSCGLIARGPCAPFFVALHKILGRLSC